MAYVCGQCSGSTVAPTYPAIQNGFNGLTTVRTGGIAAFAIAPCTLDVTNQTDAAWWNARIAAGDIIVRHDCYMSGTEESSATEQTVGACKTRFISDREQVYTINDIADTPNFDVDEFYINLQKPENQNKYQVAFFTCDGRVYPFRKMSINPNRAIEETIDGYTRWTATFTINNIEQVKPIAPSSDPLVTISLSALNLKPTCAVAGVLFDGDAVVNAQSIDLGTIATGSSYDLDIVNTSFFNDLTVSAIASDNADLAVSFTGPAVAVKAPTGSSVGGSIPAGLTFNGAVGKHTAVVTITSDDCSNPSFTLTFDWEVV